MSITRRSITRRSITRREVMLAASGLVVPAVFATAVRAQPRARVVIQPFGRALSTKDINAVKDAITAFFEVDVDILERRRHPKAAWYKPRKRWRADILLEDLHASMPKDAKQILGLTKADISVTKGPHKDWGVLGYGMIGGPACIVSRYRCRSGAKRYARKLWMRS